MRPLPILLTALLSLLAPLGLLGPAHADARPIEDYAAYQPAGTCHPQPRPGTVALARWIHHRFGGYVGMSRPCGKHRSVTSEHQAGRALDWSNDVHSAADRRRVHRLFDELFATDRHGNTDARARRMGIMYVIWNDRIFEAGNGFRPERYKNSGCRRVKRCSPTLRHRDHVHISLDGQGARGLTSWYAARR